MAYYEYVYLMRGDLSLNQVQELNSKVSDIITNYNGKVVKTEYCGLRNLAYKIKKNKKAHYCLFHFDVSHEGLKELQRLHSVNENVLRTLAVAVKTVTEAHSLLSKSHEIKVDVPAQ